MIPLVIVCRDRLEPLLQLVTWLEKVGHDRVILYDNDSAWPPLLEFYERTPFEVVRTGRNLGGSAPWTSGFIAERFPDAPYAVTDPDVVPTEDCPADLFDHLLDVLARYPDRLKAGVGLKIDDLPEHYRHREHAIWCESEFWRTELEPGVFDAPIDTTLAVHRAGDVEHLIGPSLRTGEPYVARHLTWYENTAEPTAEARFYRERASSRPGATNWTAEELPRWLRQTSHLNRTDGRGLVSQLIRVDQRRRQATRRVRAVAAYRWRQLRGQV